MSRFRLSFRCLVACLAVCLTFAAGAVPTAVLQRTAGPIAVDGRLDEPTWQKAEPLSPLRDLSGAPSAYAADIRLAYDDAYLYVAARLPAKTLRATLTQRDSVIYRDDDFEVFIDPFCRGRDYLELEINQFGTVWDLFLTAPYRDPECLALHDWDIKGLKTAVSLDGTLNQGEGDDRGWCVEIAWPWASILGHSNHPRIGKPPVPGTELRMNFSRVDHPVPGQETNTVWAPTRQATIHAPEHWGRVRVSANPVGTPEAFPPTIGLWGNANDANRFADATLRAWRTAGIDTLILGGTPANIAAVARRAKPLGFHVIAWLWALNRPDDPVALRHPDWHAVSLEGKSTFRPEDRPFVTYYQFLCPTHPGVREHLCALVRELAAIPEIDAVQLDYIRLPDVVLPKALWSHYGLDMSTLLPLYDFCYCPRCVAAFGKKPDPADPAWADFRLRQVAAVANVMADAARAAGKPCGAAVFPTPRLAAKMVYQDWSRFRLDFAFPMDYASFYAEGNDWTLARLDEARAAIGGAFPVLPGLHLPDFKDNPEALRTLLRAILDKNPEGFCLFDASNLPPALIECLPAAK